MGRQHALTYALNVGGVDPEALTRVDLEKMRLAGEHPVDNWLPRALGPMTLFPGSEMLCSIPDNDESRMLRFWRDDVSSYMLLLSPSEMRIVQDGELVSVDGVATTINTGSWSDVSTGSASGTGGASLSLTATTTDQARLRQTLSIASDDQATEHVLRVVVNRGPVLVRIGTTAGGAELMASGAEAELDDGTHHIGFTPNTGTVYVDVASYQPVARTATVTIRPSGVLVVPTPWSTISQIDALRTWQSLDVIFCGDGINQQRRIEHRGTSRSWSVAAYRSNTGPFVLGSNQITMTNAAQTGNTTITASESYFTDDHIGALIEVTHVGKTVTDTFNAADQATDHITVVGVDTGRYFYRTATQSSFVGTLVLERSFEVGEPTTWSIFQTYVDGAAAFTNVLVNDNQDNVTVHYRWRVSAYTSGTVTPTLEYAADSENGVGRIVSVASATVANIEVLHTFGNTTASRTWRIGDWSNARGWPRTPVIHDGRLHWFRGDTDFASVVDDYTNFDDDEVGDSGPFTRSVGSGGESDVRWAMSVDRLLVGTSRSEAIIAASELDGALTPTQYTVRKPSRRGSADIAAVEHDDGVMFAQRNARRLYEMRRPSGSSLFETVEVSRLNPVAYSAGIKKIAVQQQPELRIYSVLEDGGLVVFTYNRDDEIAAITTRTITGATVEDVQTLPGTEQDDVYVITNRGGTRYLERFGVERDQLAVDTCTLLDGHKVLSGSITQITGATHFASETVQVWADGARHADVTLNGSGAAALTGGPYSRVVYGKSYTAPWKSVKLEYAAGLGTAMGQQRQVRGAALILHNSCMDGIVIGPDASNTDPLPTIINGASRTANQFFDHYEHEVQPINSEWTTDSRFYVSADSAEGPVTIQALVLDVETRDGAQDG